MTRALSILALSSVLLLSTTVASHSHNQQQQLQQQQQQQAQQQAQTIAQNNIARRRTAIGDFDRFNELFENASINIDGEFEVSEKIVFTTLNLRLRNIRCFDISVGDITVNHQRNNNQDIDVLVDIVELDLRCDIDYRYDYGLLRGGGTVSVSTDNNSASTALAFTSPNFNQYPPTGSSVESCAANIDITNIEFTGDFVSNIVEIFERLIRGTIEGAIENVACEELGSLGTTFVGDMLDLAGETLEEYEGDLGPEVNNPLYPELTKVLPSDLTPLNLQDTGSVIGNWFNKALEQADVLLGSIVPDPDGPSSDGRDLGVNVLLRSHLLNANRELVVDISQLPMDPVIFQGHDKITETTITLNEIKVIGLDTLTRFNPLIAIGQHTLQNELTWESLTLEFEITIDVLPSTRDDAILQDATSNGISETIKVDFGVENLDIVASLYLIVDQGMLGTMQLGPLFTTDNLLPCLLSVIHDIDLSGLQVAQQSVNIPTLSGFVSPGIDRIITNSVQATFEMYSGVLMNRLPNIFQTSIRGFVNRDVIDSYIFDSSRVPCPEVNDVDGFVDFRDLFLAPDDAATNGGTGTAPYGDIAYTLMNVVEDNLLSTDSNGLLEINSFLVHPATEAQSGTKGMLRFPSDLIFLNKTEFANDYIRSFVSRFEIGLFDFRIYNLDTLKPPASILDTSPSSPHVLNNVVALGPVANRPINATVGFNLNLEGPGETPLAMENKVDVSLSIDSAMISSDLIAMIDAYKLLNFPLEDVLIPQCWLSLIPAPALNSDGSRVDAGSPLTLALQEFGIQLENLDMGVQFLVSSAPGVDIISDLLYLIKTTSASTMFTDRVQDFVLEIVESEWIQSNLDQALAEAPKFCPHNSDYDPNAVATAYDTVSFPGLSAKTMDSMFFAASIVGEIAFLVFAENHLRQPMQQTYVSSPTVSETSVDWKNLTGSIGTFVDSALDEARRYLGSSRVDENTGNSDLGINILIRDMLFEEGADTMIWPFDDVDFKLPGVEVELTSVTLNGLDSFTEFDFWQPIAPQVIQNTFAISSLEVQVEFSITDQETKEEIQNLVFSLSIADVQGTMPLIISLDKGRLGEIEMGSLLFTENLLPCLLSTVETIEILTLDVTIGQFLEPKVDGLMDDTAESVRVFTEEMISTYGRQIEEAFPKIFDNTLRTLLNNLVSVYVQKNNCPDSAIVTDSEYVDFRKFFDSEDNSYGNLPGLLLDLLNSELLEENDANGKPKINDVVIAGLTRRQSGVDGTLVFENDLFAVDSATLPQLGLSSVEFRAFNPTVRNLDTMAQPLSFLEPNDSNGHLLENSASFGTTDEPIQFSLNGLFALQGDPALEVRNEMELTVSVQQSEFFAALLAKVRSSSLASFPLKDTLDANCWLATIVHNGIDSGLSLDSILVTIPSFDFDISCTNCTSSGLLLVPELLQMLKDIGISDLLEGRIVDLGLELLRSDYIQSLIDRSVMDGSLRCPSSPYYIDPSASSGHPVAEYPTLSYDSLESVTFAGAVLMQVATVVIAESHESYNLSSSDPLSGQAELDEEGLESLIDYTSLESTIGEWADVGIDQLLEYLSTDLGNGRGLRINGWLRDAFLDDDGQLGVEFDDVSFGGEEMEVSLKRIRVSGLDTISSLDVLDAIGAQTLRNQLKWERLGVEVVVSLKGPEASGSDISGEASRMLEGEEEITLSLELSEIEVSLALLLAMDLDVLGSLELSSMLEIKNILPCMLSAANRAKLTELEVNVGSIMEYSVIGFRSDDLNIALSESSNKVLEEYGDKILASMPGFFDLTVRAMLNNWIETVLDDWSNENCASDAFTSSPLGFVDLRDLLLSAAKSRLLGGSGLSQYGNVFRTAYEYVQDLVFKVDEDTEMSKANRVLVEPLTRRQSNETGSFVYKGDLLNTGTRVSVGGLNANVKLRAHDARIDNLNSIGAPMSLLDLMMNKSDALNNTATFGIDDKPVRLSTKFLISLIGDDDMQLHNELDMSLDLGAASMAVEIMAKIAEARFYSFPMRDALNYNCWLAMIPSPVLDSRGIRVDDEDMTMELRDLAASVASMNLNISCIDCSSPRMEELTDLLSTAEAQEDVTEVANSLLEYAVELMGGEFMQVQIDRMLNDAARKCPHSALYEDEFIAVEYEAFASPSTESNVSYLMLLGGVAVGLIVVISVVMSIVRCYVRYRHGKWTKSLSEDQARRLAAVQAREEAYEMELNGRTESMFRSSSIPKSVRWSMPLILVGNIGFFLSGHLSLGATVNIEAELAGETVRAEQFFEFSMAKSTVDIWNAGGKELAILILIFSGIWPYTKQLITLVLWFLPPTRVSASRRGSILLWLDWLAKWSMVDIFVLVISIAAFRVSISSPSVGFLPDDFYSLDLMVVPLWGLYANMIAQLISQVSSHFIIHYHRKIVDDAKALDESDEVNYEENDDHVEDGEKELIDCKSIEGKVSKIDSEERETLYEHCYSRPHRGETERLVVRRWVNMAVCACVLILGIFVILGSIIPSFSLDILGIIGVAVESGQEFDDATTHHSVFTVVKLLMDEAKFLGGANNFIGLGSLSLLLVVSVMIVPIIQAFALARQWFVASTMAERRRMSIFVEVLQAWQYAEVYLIAIFVASWQLGPISEFMINSYCKSLEDTFAEMVYFGILKEEDAQCFSVESSVGGGSFLLAVGAILLALVNTFVTKAVTQYVRDASSKDKLDVDDDLVDVNESENMEGVSRDDVAKSLQPVPVLFSDTFRWLLTSLGSGDDEGLQGFITPIVEVTDTVWAPPNTPCEEPIVPSQSIEVTTAECSYPAQQMRDSSSRSFGSNDSKAARVDHSGSVKDI